MGGSALPVPHAGPAMPPRDGPIPFGFKRIVDNNQLKFTIFLEVLLGAPHHGEHPSAPSPLDFQAAYSLTKANTSAANSRLVMSLRQRRGKESGNSWKPQYMSWSQKIFLKMFFC